MYYGLIMLSVVLFGTSFFFQDEYRKLRGNNFKISLQYTITGTVAGLVVLLIINKFRLQQPFFLSFTIKKETSQRQHLKHILWAQVREF